MKTKQITCRLRAWLLTAFTLLASFSAIHAATNDVGSLLQKGLFEEEANHNLDAAIQAYQSAILQTDKDHQFAATAIFRLGECYRKQGKTNEASAQYQRILREFPDQTELVRLSRSFFDDVALAGKASAPELQVVTVDTEAEELNRIKTMIKDNPDLINGTGGQNIPLIKAVEQNQLTVAKFLLDNKADVNARSGGNGATAIITAAAKGSKEMVKLLLDHGADVNDTSLPTTERFAPLHLAAMNGYKSLAEVLLARKADVNIKTTSGKTPLHLAAEKGFTALADLLLAHDADVNARDNSGETPLHDAAASGNKATTELLIAHKAETNAKKTTGETPLHFAVKANRNDLVKLLLDSQADPNVKATVYLKSPPPNQMSSTYCAAFAPLTIAAFSGQKVSAELLLAHKADVNIRDAQSFTPLHWSVMKGQPQIAELLLNAGADVNAIAIGYNATTPLLSAVANIQKSMVELLLAHKANPDLPDNLGNTPLSLTVNRGQLSQQQQGLMAEIAELLLKAGANENLQRLSSIGVGRGNFEQNIFLKGTNSFNHFGFFELIASFYGYHPPLNGDNSWPGLRFPDFAKIKINRLGANGRTNILNINLETALNTGDCSKDMPLEWGDIVEIPESDHKVSEQWPGLSQSFWGALRKCLERKVEIIVKGQTSRMTLVPTPPYNIQNATSSGTLAMQSFWLKDVVSRANVLLASSDTTRVKVKRANPATGQTDEMIFNLEKTDPNTDLWLRDGDVIEIPEKP